MNNYSVVRKSDGIQVYQYSADAPIEWGGYEFDTYEHVLQEVVVIPPEITTMYSGRRILSKLEFRRLFTTDEQELCDEFELFFEGNAALTTEQKRSIRTGLKNFNAATEVNLDDLAILPMLQLYAYLQLIDTSRVVEILNG